MKRYNQMSDVLCKITFEYNGPYRRRAGDERRRAATSGDERRRAGEEMAVFEG